MFKENNYFYDVDDVAQTMKISKAKAYKVIKQLNDELKVQGYITVSGKISRKYFQERCYGC